MRKGPHDKRGNKGHGTMLTFCLEMLVSFRMFIPDIHKRNLYFISQSCTNMVPWANKLVQKTLTCGYGWTCFLLIPKQKMGFKA